MRRYISQERLDETRSALVDQRDEELLDICSQLAKYRSQQNSDQSDYIQDMLHIDNRIFLAGFDTLVTLYGIYILRRLCLLQAGSPVLWCFSALFLLWVIYLMYEIVSIAKIYRQARRFILVDELIERRMIYIGEIRN